MGQIQNKAALRTAANAPTPQPYVLQNARLILNWMQGKAEGVKQRVEAAMECVRQANPPRNESAVCSLGVGPCEGCEECAVEVADGVLFFVIRSLGNAAEMFKPHRMVWSIVLANGWSKRLGGAHPGPHPVQCPKIVVRDLW